jgi:Zn-dependent dipeptidase, microsomal dipeptidase homolog
MRTLLSVTMLVAAFWVGDAYAQMSSGLKSLYQATDAASAVKLQSKEQAPVIGISVACDSEGHSRLSEYYVDAVIIAGGTPYLIPATTNLATLKAIAEGLDGLILSGGADVTPALYSEGVLNETIYTDSIRDTYEFSLIKFAANRNVPILGICRGGQLINVAFGGTLYQDLPSQRKSDVEHRQKASSTEITHKVGLVKGTQFAEIMKNVDSLSVNTLNHQAIKDVAPTFRVTAISPDGVIEGIEAFPNRNIFAVQWHPEALFAGGDKESLEIFKFLVKKAKTFRYAHTLHDRILSLDTHSDTPMIFSRRQGFDVGNRDSALVDLPKMKEGRLDAIFMAAFLRQGDRDDASLLAAVQRTNDIIKEIYSQVERNADYSGIASTEEDLIRLKAEGKKSIFIGIENGYAIGKDLTNLKKFRNLGVTYMTLCHSRNNDICDSSSDRDGMEWNGLSPFGEQVIAEMNRLGMLIDLSHAHEKTFWDVIKISKHPVVATHSSVRAIRDHDRNLTDEQLKGLAANGGVVQVCPLGSYISDDRHTASISQLLDHIDHIVRVAGIDHVGIGSDFDGGGKLIGLDAANDLINVTTGLIERGYTDEEIEKIWGGNFLRVMNIAQNDSKK